jgi:hypothetical protein
VRQMASANAADEEAMTAAAAAMVTSGYHRCRSKACCKLHHQLYTRVGAGFLGRVAARRSKVDRLIIFAPTATDIAPVHMQLSLPPLFSSVLAHEGLISLHCSTTNRVCCHLY